MGTGIGIPVAGDEGGARGNIVRKSAVATRARCFRDSIEEFRDLLENPSTFFQSC